jgi:ATP-dependent Clp protease ATP-binding subunit ClpB
LERQLNQPTAVAEQVSQFKLLRNKVTDEEIAEVVSKWTGIPVAKMLEGERDKLLRMEEAIQRSGWWGRVKRSNRSATRFADLAPVYPIPNGPTVPSCFSARPASVKTELCKALAANSCLIPKKRNGAD